MIYRVTSALEFYNDIKLVLLAIFYQPSYILTINLVVTLISKYVLSAYHVSGIVLAAKRATKMNQAWILS